MADLLRILLIEDSEDDAFLEMREVKKHFEEIEWKRVERKAEVFSSIIDGEWDIILCDYMLPDLKPEEVLHHLRDHELDIPVIVVSGRVDEETVVELMKAGASDYVLKDNLTRLAPAMKREVMDARHRRARHQAETSLRENRRFLASLLQTLPGVVYRCDWNKSWTMRYMSQSCLELTGYDPYHLINDKKTSFNALVHPDDRDRVWEEVSRDIHANRPFQVTYRIITANGDIRWVMDHGRYLKTGPNEEDVLEGYLFNITNAKQTELALEESRIRFRSISDASHDAIIMINSQSQVVYWNRAAERIFGYTDKEIIGRNVSHYILPQADASTHTERIAGFGKDTFADVTGRTLELTARRKSGDHFPIELSLSAVDLNGSWHAVASIRDITERQQTVNALVESEEKFRHVVEESVEAICLIRGNQFLFINSRFTEIFGYSEDEVLSETFSVTDLISPEDQDLQREISLRFRARELDNSLISFSIHDKSGEVHYVEASLSTIRYSGKQAILAILRDLTEQRDAQKALRENEERFRLLAENAQDVIFRFVFDPEPHYEYISPAVEKFTGYAPEEFYQDPELSLKIIHPEDIELYRQKFYNGQEYDELVRLRWLKKDGGFVWAEQRNVIVRNPDGSVQAVEGIIRDITKQYLGDQERRVLSHVIEKSPNSIIITDANGTIEYVNSRFTEVTGFESDDAIGENPKLLKSGKHSREFYKELWDTVLSGEVWRGELTNRRKNGSLYTESAIISPIVDANGVITHLFALKVDITERTRLLEERERLESELARQFHLSQVGLLASGIAHNLRSPLSVITMYVEMMQRNLMNVLKDPPADAISLYEHLEDVEGKSTKIRSAAERIEQIINDIMAYQQMNQHVGEKAIDLNSLISADAAILQADLDLKHKVTTRLELYSGPLWVNLRSSDVSQIFLNLVSNARDAMLESEVRMLTIRSGKNEESNEIWFDVHDTGKGIPEEALARLGEPFFTTKSNDPRARERGSGTGLGLYMIQRQLEQVQGRMDVVSVPGDTSFRIVLPEATPKIAVKEKINH